MPRVALRKKSVRGTARCGNCGAEISPGEKYYSWAFRYGGKQTRCKDHPPKPSELTQSKMNEVYAAIETANDEIAQAETTEDINLAVQAVAEVANQIMEEYREAAEHFGGAGENAERADELEGFASEVENFEAEENDDIEEFNEDEVRSDLCQELFGIDNPTELDDPDEIAELDDELTKRREEFEDEMSDRKDEALEGARDQAYDVLGQI